MLCKSVLQPSSEVVPLEPVVIEKPTAKDKDDEDTSMHTTVVIFSVDDKFTSSQVNTTDF